MRKSILKAISLALCLFLCLSFLPQRASAATKINKVTVYVDDPRVGGKPNLAVDLPQTATYTVNTSYSDGGFSKGVRWDDLFGYSLDPANDRFEEESRYQVCILLKANSGYEFDFGNVEASVNGGKASLGRIGDSLLVIYEFGPLHEIRAVDLLINNPAAGMSPSYEINLRGETHYYNAGSSGNDTLDGVTWYDDGNNTTFQVGEGVFQKGGLYRVVIYLDPVWGAYFRDDNILVYLNGKAVKDVRIEYNGRLRMSYQFPAAGDAIESISAGIKEPQIGKSPSYDVTLPSGAGYFIDNVSYGNLSNGVLWKTGSDELVPGRDSFEAGKQYTVSVRLRAAAGCVFNADSLSGSVNGRNATVSADGSSAVLSCTFDTLKYNINYVALDITPPEDGTRPSYSLARLTSHCSVSKGGNDPWKTGVNWFNVTDGINLSTLGDSFDEGKQYRVRIILTPDAGYRFNLDNLEAKVNGEAAEVSSHGNDGIMVEYTFPVLSNMIRYVSVTIDEPKAGERPSHALTLPYGAHYKVAESYGVKNGVRWQDYRLSQNLDPERDVFQADTRYMVSFWLTSDAGYSFDPDNLTVKVNGRESAARFIGGSDIRIDYVFDRLPEESAIQWGDVNGDGKPDSDDAMLILRYDVKKIGKDKLKIFEAADVDGSGTVDSDDAMLILRYDVKKIAKFPAEK